MTVIPSPAADRLFAENAALRALVDRYKQREEVMAHCIATMMNTPSQSVASAKYTDGQWEVVMTTGHVWRRVEKLISNESEHRYVELWVPRPAVPGSRAAHAEAMDAEQDITPPLHLLPDRVA